MIGREGEIHQLKSYLQTDEAELVAIVGRRRIGKTYLVRETYKEEIVFELTGIQSATKQEQLSNFRFGMNQYFDIDANDFENIVSWVDAFQLLIDQLCDYQRHSKLVVFIDELPWLAAARSGFMKGLEFFWNSWASKNNIVLVTCGSATSWMIDKIILNRGGLHNRVTRQINLEPFTLYEVDKYLSSRNIILNQYQTTQIYMTFGGIPYYLKQISKGQSVALIVAELLLKNNAPLKYEFENLYKSLFSNYENYIKIIKACYYKWEGVSNTELSEITKIPSGGGLTRMVRDLAVSGFLKISSPYDKKKKNSLIRLVDEFSIFYLKFIDSQKDLNWIAISQSQSFKSWQGFAFENLCLKHVPEIKEKLGIRAVNTRVYSYRKENRNTEKGTQIDLLIDRDDDIINLCEIKFYSKPFSISKDYRGKLEKKQEVFTMETNGRKSIHLTFISTYGVKTNLHSGMIQSEIQLSDLFEKRKK